LDDRELDSWGPGIVLQPDNFVGRGSDTTGGENRFTERQDAIHRLNVGLAGTDAQASELLNFVPTSDDFDFSAEMENLFRRRRSEILKDLRHPADRDEAIQSFEDLMRRHMGRAFAMNLDRRVRARAAGAEQALERIVAAAVADPDRLFDRLTDADVLLGRMVETGVNASAAAKRAQQFRGQVGGAILDDLAMRDPPGAIARLDDGLFDPILDVEDKKSIRADFVRIADADARAAGRRAVLSGRSEAFDSGARRRTFVAELSSALRSDRADEGAIERAFYRGEIDEDDANDLRARLEQFDEERARLGEEIDHLDTVVKGGLGPVSRSWPQETVDAWWDRERDRGASAPDFVPDCFGVTGRIPRPYTDGVRSLVLSGIPDDTVAAGRQFRALRERSSQAADALLAGLPPREARDLAATADYAHLDLPAERVAELVQAEEKRAQSGTLPSEPRGRPMGSGLGRKRGPLPAPTDEPINAEELRAALEYEADGPGDLVNGMIYGLTRPRDMQKLMEIEQDARSKSYQMYRDGRLSRDETDAFRHAYWSLSIANLFGPHMAKAITDGHERKPWDGYEKRALNVELTYPENDDPEGEGEILRDLYNNRIGREILRELRASDKTAEDIVLDALKTGKLQLRKFTLKE